MFVIDFPGSEQFSFFLDRKSHLISLDVAGETDVYSKHFEVSALNDTTAINNLAISFMSKTIKISVDCEDIVLQEMDFNLSETYKGLDEPIVKLFRERKYPLHVLSEVDDCENMITNHLNLIRDKINKSKGT